MKRPTAAAVALGLGAAALAAAIVAGGAWAATRRGEVSIARRASATLRREARAPRPARAPAKPPLRVCPEGAEGLAPAARRALGAELFKGGAIDPAALARISNLAIGSARYLERARAAPALPQRLGRQRGKDGWEPLVPPATGCARVATP